MFFLFILLFILCSIWAYRFTNLDLLKKSFSIYLFSIKDFNEFLKRNRSIDKDKLDNISRSGMRFIFVFLIQLLPYLFYCFLSIF